MRRKFDRCTCFPFFVGHLRVVFPFSRVFHHELDELIHAFSLSTNNSSSPIDQSRWTTRLLTWLSVSPSCCNKWIFNWCAWHFFFSYSDFCRANSCAKRKEQRTLLNMSMHAYVEVYFREFISKRKHEGRFTTKRRFIGHAKDGIILETSAVKDTECET